MLNFNDWLSSKSREDIEWLLKEFGSLTKAYDNYIKTYYNDNVLGTSKDYK